MAYTKIFTINCHGVTASLVRNSTTITTISGTENEAISGNNLNMSNYITATACTPTYSASGLPIGLTINSSTGVISGTPTSSASGNITITVSATGLQSVIFTVPYSIEAASSGGSGYTVTGASTSSYNGTYTASARMNNDQPVYTNDSNALWMYKYWASYSGSYAYAWILSPLTQVTESDNGNPTWQAGFPIAGSVANSSVTPDNVSYWSNGAGMQESITVTGSGGSGSSSSGGGSFVWGTTSSITVSGAVDRYNGTYTWDGSKYVKSGNLDIWIRNPNESLYQIFDDDYGSVIYQYSGSNIDGTNTWYSPYYEMNAQITISDSSGGDSSSSGSSSSGGLPTEPIGTEKLVISGGEGMVWSIYNGDYVIVAGTSSSTNSIWYNSSNGYYILYVDGYWRVDSDGVTPFDASIDTRLSPSDWSGVSDTTYNLRFTYSAGGSSGGGSFVWGTTQSFTISGSGSSAINTTYTWNTQSYAYKANNNDYYVTYMAGHDQVSITYNQSMTEYYINGTGGDIGGTKTWSNLMSGGSETLTVTVIS